MSFFNELKRRNVFRVAIAYIISAWLLLQVADVLVPILALPEWAARLIFLILLIGFPLALFFAWAFELTPEGLKREHEVNRDQSIAPQTGHKLDRAIMVVMGLALAYFIADKFWLSAPAPERSPAVAETEAEAAPSIAVLPLADMSPQGDHEYFSDGLTEELLNILAKIGDLRVAGRTSSFAFKGKNEDLREIAQKLNVSTILEGSVRKDDQRNRVRITLQLINAEDGYHLWSETYDRDLDDIFTIQEEVANEVAKALKVTLLGEEAPGVEHVAVTGLEAYDLYLRGLQGINEFSYASLERAIQDMQQALELDPDYLPAQIGLLKAWKGAASTGAIPVSDAREKVRPVLERLVQREPGNSELRTLMGWLHLRDRDYAAAEQSFRQAVELDPQNVEALNELGSFLRDRERLFEGMEYLQRAALLEPYATQVQWDLCWTYMWTGLHERALQACGKIGEIEPGNPMQYYGPSQAHTINGNLAQAVRLEKLAYQKDPDDHELQAELGELWLSLGDDARAAEWIDRSLAVGPGEARPVSAKISLLMHREEYTQAAVLAEAHIELDGRRNSRPILRNAIVREALRSGDTDAALEAFRAHHPWIFEDPMEIDMDLQSWNAHALIEAAVTLRAGNLASDKADRLLAAARTIIDGADPALVQYLDDLWQAALASASGDSEAALTRLHAAFEHGFRDNWRFWIQHWFVFDGLRGEPEYRRLINRYEEDVDRQREEAVRLIAQGIGP